MRTRAYYNDLLNGYARQKYSICKSVFAKSRGASICLFTTKYDPKDAIIYNKATKYRTFKII